MFTSFSSRRSGSVTPHIPNPGRRGVLFSSKKAFLSFTSIKNIIVFSVGASVIGNMASMLRQYPQTEYQDIAAAVSIFSNVVWAGVWGYLLYKVVSWYGLDRLISELSKLFGSLNSQSKAAAKSVGGKVEIKWW